MSNFNFNKVILGGRLTGDPELRQTTGGIPVASFSVAVNRRVSRQQDQQNQQGQQSGQQGQPTADFFNVVAWRERAEFVSRYFRKGSAILVVGTIQNRNWVDQQNVKHYATDIVADEIQFVDSRADSAGPGYGPQPAGQPQQSQPSRDGGKGGQQYTPDSYGAPAYSGGSDSAPKFEEVSDDANLPF